ncbi:endonuclease V [Haloarcula rubripromontorii]|uniref:Endonuclease V n=1 Tax=Haloarcula rubripromontorii TaxID=1705562 RepID=A0A847TUB5_9EURY|nr:endonuclease V [Haloarcula rubripromontorii]NLV06783.1 endonuclease V [Haloarcula rubripromontorii]
MHPVRPEFVPDPSLSQAAMEALQRDIAEAARFEDDLGFSPQGIAHSGDAPDGKQTTLRTGDGAADPPLVAGVDQAFVDDRAVSAIVVLQNGEVVERVSAVERTEIPYIPGLLSFREGGAILAAFAELETDPDVVLVDGSGRIHFREAGLATHIGVTLDVPAVGVAKNLLCGTPEQSLDETYPEGTRIPITADDSVETCPDGTVIGHALQTRQYDSPNRYINPLIVSPGHRLSAGTAAALVEATADGYKLPEPTRLADSYADEAKESVE